MLAVLLAMATVNDVGRQVDVNQRLIADLRTWRHYTGHDYHNLSVEQELLGRTTQHEVVCGNTSPGCAESPDPDLPGDLGSGGERAPRTSTAAGTCRPGSEDQRQPALRLLRRRRRQGSARG